MKTAVINIKTDPKIKLKAQKVAEELGFSLSALINSYLRRVIETKTVHFTINEEPTEYLLNSLRESEEDRLAGRVSAEFDDSKDAIAWLNRKKRHAR